MLRFVANSNKFLVGFSCSGDDDDDNAIYLFEIWGPCGVEDVVIGLPGCNAVGSYERFARTYCLHLQLWRLRQSVPEKRWYLSASHHGVTTRTDEVGIYLGAWLTLESKH
jgi:hypothetical protein